MRFVLLRTGSGSTNDLGDVAALEGVEIVDSSLEKAILVEASSADVLRESLPMQQWSVFPEASFDRPERGRFGTKGPARS